MTTLTTQQLDRLSLQLADLHALGPIELFPARVLGSLDGLIGCDSASYNEIDLDSASFRVLVEPIELAEEGMAQAFRAHVREHPVIAHYASTGDADAHLLSDFLSPRGLRRLGLYREFFAPLGIESQMSVTLKMGEGGVLGVALNRGREGFTGQERLLLDLARPHLLVAHSNALRYSAASAAASSSSERATHARGELERLTDRQRHVLSLVSRGLTNQQIAYELGLSSGTVKKHLEQILGRLDVRTRVAAAGLYLAATPPPSTGVGWRPTLESD